MTAPREPHRQPSPPDRLPPRRGGRFSPYTYAASAAARPVGLVRLAGARRWLVRSARTLAAVALLALAAALALPATAQAQEIVLVSNIAERSDNTLSISSPTFSIGSVDVGERQEAQRFTAGPNTAGYVLQSVVLNLSSGGSNVRVQVAIHENNSSGNPGAQLAVLDNPADPFGVTRTFSAPSPLSLVAGSLYWVVISNTTTTSSAFNVSRTQSNEQTTTQGFSIRDTNHKGTPGSWDEDLGYAVRIEVRGTVVPPTLSVADASATEGSPVPFTVTLSEASTQTVTVDWTTLGLPSSLFIPTPIYTADPSDYVPGAGTLTFAPGETEKTVSVQTLEDTAHEIDEPFRLLLSNPTNAVFAGEGNLVLAPLGTIVDDDDPPVVSVEGGTVGVGGDVIFTVRLSPGSGKWAYVYVRVTTVADDGTQIGSSPQSFSFYPGVTELKSARLNRAPEEAGEVNTLTFTDDPEGATVPEGTSATIRVVDATGLPAVTIAADDASVTEESGEAGFTLTRTEPLTEELTVTVELKESYYSDVLPDEMVTLQANYDRTVERTVMFAANAATAALAVPLKNDELAEGDADFTVEVKPGDGYTVGDPALARVTVTDASDPGAVKPEHLQAIAGPGVGEVVLSWAAPLRFYEVSRHEYRYKTDGVYEDWVEIPDSGQSPDALTAAHRSGYAVTGLTGGQTHTFEVRAVNVVSGVTTASAASNETMATPRTAALVVSFGESDYTVDEGGTVEVTVRLNGVPGREVVVPVSAAGAGGATGEDWSGVPENVTFGALAAAQTFTLTATDDTDADAGESVALSFGTLPAGVTAGTPSEATVTIVDDDVPVVTIAADKTSVLESEGAAGFTLSRTGSTAAELAVTVAVTQQVDRDLLPDGAAAERTVTFAVGSVTMALSVALENDDLSELLGELTVEVQAGMGYTVGAPGSATVTVLDVDTGRPQPANLMAEAEAGIGEVVLSWDAHAPGLSFRRHQYRYKTDGNYVGWTDIPNSGLNDTEAGDGSNLTGYTVTGLVGGQVHTFQVRTSTQTDGSDASDPSEEATATPRSAAVSFGAGSYSVDEGGTVEVTVELDAAPGREVTVPVSAAGAGGATPPGETGADWSGVPENVTFGATDTAQTFTLAATDDTDVDAGESVALSFGTLPDGMTSGTPSEATVTIVDNDVLPSVSVGDTTATEGDDAVFTAALSEASGRDVTVDWATTGDTATSPADFTAANGTLTFMPGETTATVAVATEDDTLDEDDETFTLTLSSPSNATLAADATTATGTITDNDDPPTLGVADAAATEGDPVEFTVTLSAAATDDVTATWTASTIEGDEEKAAAADLESTTGSVTVPKGETTATFTVATAEDALDENNETFTVALSSPSSNATLAADATTATGTITDDDARPALIIADVSAPEDSNVEFTVTLTPASGRTVTVGWGTFLNSGQTAEEEDFTSFPQNGFVTFPPGQTTAQLQVTVFDDALVESDETFEVILGSASNARLEDNSAIGTIVDNDVAPNAAPAFTSSDTFTPAENQTAAGTVRAGDFDGDAITDYALSGGADQALFSIGSTSGALTFLTAPNYEDPQDANTDNAYVVVVQATSGTGDRELTATQTITVMVMDDDTEAPAAPDAPSVSPASVTSLNVSWSAPDNAGPEITDYDVQYRAGTSAPWSDGSHIGTALTTILTGLEEDTSYQVQVRATNAEGTGGWSASGSGATDANAAPSFTSAATFNPAENQTAVGTVAASDSDASDAVTGYELAGGADQSFFSIGSDSGVLTFLTAPNYEDPQDANTDNAYVVVVQATSGTGDREQTGTQTITVMVMDDDTEAPAAPDAPSVSPASVTSLTVSWSAPDNDGPEITDYDVQYRAGTSGPWSDGRHIGTALTAILTGLLGDTSYQVQVRATNAEGTGGWSASGSGATDANAAPSFTSAATFNPAENQTAVGTVAASDSDASDAVTGYELAGGADQSFFSIGSDSGVLTFLTAPNYEDPQDANTDNAYVVVVQATSGTGDREQTGTQTITVMVMDDDTEAPGAPDAPSVSPASVTSLTVSWSAPDNDGPEITDYDVQYRAGTSGPWSDGSHIGTALTAILTGLLGDTSYQVQVRATNAEGTGGWSASGSGATDANAAPSFTSSATFNPAENQTAVGTVRASDSDASDAVTGYELSGGTDQALFSIGSTSGVLTFQAAPNYEDPQDANTDNAYLVVVQATSGTGDREKTADQTITVTVRDDDTEAPGAPDAPSVSPASVTSLNVSWSAPDNAGPEITDYDVQYRAGTSAPWSDGSHIGTALTAILTGLEEDTSYQVQVRATNDEGTGGWSASGSGSTDANAAPSFTSSATFTPAENQTTVGTVQATDSDGDAITDYALSGGTDQALFSIGSTSGVLTFNDAPNYEDPQDVNTDNAYLVVVQATSGTGARVKTATQTITVTVRDVDEQPDKPAKPTAAAVSGSTTSLDVSWTAPGLNGGPAITGYNVQYQSRANATDAWSAAVDWTHTGTTTTTTITGLTANTEYQVHVQALNGETPSAWSDYSDAVRTNSAANNAPVFSGTPTRTVPENSAAGTNVGAVIPEAMDADNDALTYSMEGTDATSFAFNASTRQITTITGVDYNYEATKNSYEVTVKASDGTASATVDVSITVTDEDEQPDKPAKPTVTAASGKTDSLDVTWTEPGRNGGPEITSYSVEYREGTTGTWIFGSLTAAVTLGITGLTEDTEYQVQVRALNGETPSAWSDPSDAVRTNSAANAPVFSEINLTREVPENSAAGTNVGAPVTADAADPGDTLTYSLEGTDASLFDIVSTSGQIQTKSGVTYDYEATRNSYDVAVKASAVTASDATASAIVSVTINVTDVDEQPDKPAKPTLAAVSGSSTSLDVSWTAPGLNSGPAITGYNVEYQSRANATDAWSTAVDWTHTGTTTTTTITGLTANTEYQVQVRALNGETPSAFSDPSDAVRTNAPPATIPPGLEVTLQLSHDRILEFPSPVTVTATVSPASPVAFTVAISATPVAPATADDFTLSTNRVLRFAADATESTGTVRITPVDDDIPEPHDVVRVSGAVSNAAIPDPDDVTVEIVNNDPEDFDLAVDAPAAVDEGAGAAVVTVTFTTRQNTAPVANIDMFFVVERGTATRGADYTPPPGRDFGTTSGIHFDTVRPSAFSPNAAGTAWVAEHSFTIGIIDDQEAELAETIVFTVKLSEVETPAHTITIRDNDAIASDRPTDLEAAAKSQTRIQLAWTAPSAGSFSVTGYRIEVSESAAGPWIVVAADTRNTRPSWGHGGLSAGDTRHYRVSAISPAGTSGPSNVASATTIAAGPGATNAALPPPQDVNAEPKLPGEIRLSWWRNPDAPSHDLVDRHQYRYRVRDAGAWTVDWTTVNQTQTMPPPGTTETRNYNKVLLQGLTAGTTYEFQVRAVDKADGTSAAVAVLGTATGRQMVWIVADVGSVAEGEPLRFTLWRDQSHGPMMAIVRIGETGDMLPPDGRSPEGLWHQQVHFGDGNERIPLVLDTVDDGGGTEPDSAVTVEVMPHPLYPDNPDNEHLYDVQPDLGPAKITVTAAAGGSSAGTVAEPLTASFEGMPGAHDGESAFSFRIAFSEAVSVTPEAMRTDVLDVAGGAVTGAARVGGASGMWEITVTPDSREELSITLAPAEECAADGAVCTSDGRALSNGAAHIVSGPGPDTGPAPLTATFPASVYASAKHKGPSDRPQVVVAFNEPVAAFGADTPSVSATGASVDSVYRLDKEGLENAYVFFLTPEGHKAIVFRLHANRACTDGGICTADRQQLSNSPSATIAGPSDDAPEQNTAATGAPMIGGTPRVGEELTASTSGISDADGLDDADFAYQWIRAGADIGGATGSSYTPVDADEGTRLKVRVSFTDDAGNAESLVSAASAAVEAAPPTNTAATGAPAIGGTPQVGKALTASTSGISDADGLDDADFAYQWMRAGADIGGATGSSYTPGDADEGARLKVRVDFTDDAGNAESLVSAASAAVEAAAEPLTASFEGMPAQHDGQGSFRFRVAFSDGIKISYKTLRDVSFRVTAGEVTGANRVDGRRDRWQITVKPDSREAVRVRLPAGSVETSDGRGLERAVSATIAGPVGITVDDAQVREAPGAMLDFAVSLSRAAPGSVRVDYATSDGTAAAGSDYTARSGTLTFTAGETSKMVSVPVLDDAHDDGGETLTLTLSNASGARIDDARATGTIDNDDPLQRAWLARFGRTAAEHVLDGVQARLSAPRNAGMEASLAGRNIRGRAFETGPEQYAAMHAHGGAAAWDGLESFSHWMANGIDEAGSGGSMAGGMNARNDAADSGSAMAGRMNARNLTTGSAFALTADMGGGSSVAVWGRGAYSGFSGQDGDVALDGEVATAMLGTDYAAGPWIAGLSLSFSEGDGTYRLDGREGTLNSSMTGLYPYVGYEITDRLSAWGVAGYGRGDMTLSLLDSTNTIRTDIGLTMGAMGARGELVPRTAAAGFGLAVTSDVLVVSTTSDAATGLAATDADVSRLRLGLDGSWLVQFDGGASITPSFEIGMRNDGGDAETGFGVDIGGGLAFANAQSGFGFEVNARGLLAHEDSDFREWGVSGAFRFDPNPSSELGLSLSVGPSWGASPTGGVNALLGRETMAGVALDGATPQGGRLGTEAAWGFPAFGGRYTGTPYLGLGLTEVGRDYRFGWRLGVVDVEALQLSLGLEGTRRESGGRPAEHGAMLLSSLRW